MRISIKTICLSLGVLVATSSTLHAQEKTTQETQQSCRNFAQGFYDWYVPKLNSGGSYATALKFKSRAFSAELFRLLKAASVHDAKSNDDVFLDFEPILGGQDWPKRVVADKARIKGDRCWVNNAELLFKDGGWIFVNFHYGKDKGDDLLSILRSDFREPKQKHPK